MLTFCLPIERNIRCAGRMLIAPGSSSVKMDRICNASRIAKKAIPVD